MIEPGATHNGHDTPAGPAPRRELPLVVGDRTYTLVESMNAYCRAEALTASTTADLVLEAARGGMRATRALLWAHLQANHAGEVPTLEAAGDLVDAVGIEAVWAQLQTLAGLEAAPAAGSRQVRRARARSAGVK